MIEAAILKDPVEEGLEMYLKKILGTEYPMEQSCLASISNGVISFVNDKICSLSKFSREALIGQSCSILNAAFTAKFFIHNMRTAVVNGEIWHGEIKIISRNGTSYWLSATIVPFLNEDGNPYRYVATGIDITEKKRADEFLIANKELAFQNEEKEKRAAELIIANKELAFQDREKEKRAAELVIADKELVFQNEEKEKRAAELIIANKELVFQDQEKKKRAAELIIADIELVFQNEEKEKRAAELIIANKELIFQNREKEKRAAELIIANKELIFQNEEKEKRAAELIIANKELAFQNEEKEKRAAELIMANKELIFQNQEKEKRAEELITANRELESANKELESFSYSVSHDLRAPLRAINGYARMLSEDYGASLDQEANRVMNNIMNNAKKMGQLIDDLLAFSRLGRKELIRILIPMHEMVSNLCTEIKKEQENRNIEFKINNLQSARGDSVVIKQVWVNLISNAVKYTRLNENAVIEIGSQVNGNYIDYFIKDNGVGFDMRYANKLFGVFHRLNPDDKFEGTGVGLAIVHRIISKHGGKVWAEGKVNDGAIFQFSLPMNKSI